jgi:hypothetical protein
MSPHLLDAANTNLFYMNIMHDVWYQYGFNEANGNFQENNNSKGGLAFCECRGPRRILRRSKSLNNANFSTPRDGNIPRMQMFLWNRGPEISPIKKICLLIW